MYALRTRFKNGIVAEFLPPKKKSDKVIILCSGMPSVPAKTDLMEFFAKKNYWVFYPRYRGTWESGGRFLKVSPHKDILEIISQLPRGFKDLWSGKTYKIQPSKIYLLGSSFGGAAALLTSVNNRVTKVVAVSPVVDWRVKSKSEPVDWLCKFVKQAFGGAFRFSMADWNKLKNGKFYNPVSVVKKVNGKKIFIIHAKDDWVVNYKPVKKFTRETNSQLLLLKRGGHLSLSLLQKPQFYKKFKNFIDSK
ncbi:hypothetical protein A3G55_04315 [Candidatus Giovannonibacteria bacterium RIFCSPLOWO2_12_FULL_44_25]|uniref:Peptidase S9 prolyl oligopeptidase catalytic domain-containing protein n=2 Tax=Candidatus Giovannoniibacteriota TaxID=1752738 RepID=A0A1F5W734_9BACT|nr:MAG: hypothetical protein UW15_C0002G0028 [Parcubacteria group bacterium GW2011_GWC1_44_10]KKT59943.1 MAG: hypothetical protein UW53_C0005G0026 [Candidatus Giovannonibacteria bacterium GW2011_GWA1_44_25]KKU29742.1 MAG: hypothetical protein UX43_C0006G0017 [Candidatus Giovannonibacteria bacterium GW2011_GWB1_46_20]OGF49151.1 MAG: hypothetical protein A2120_01695 [Candidatus Giovannonibacteria bacterium GWA2_45_15]OGF59186.1 MAG: hypothetical protein A2W40_04810 [Candidatus Giovannonibacteria 